ncbi:MAG: DUF3553 domain-containing protein [Pseudomonadota bacterium]
MANMFLEVGALVRHRLRPDWGLGQIQSMIAGRVTVNFENEGKVVLVGDDPQLELVESDRL